jgi:serine/threonine protein kinase
LKIFTSPITFADFGLSRQLDPGKMQTYCGTPATMAPEIARQEEYNEKADVFSFGIILWELLTREEPYPGCSGLSLAFAVATRGLRPPIPAYCPAEWAALMVRCWSDSQTQRPSFDEIQRYLAIVVRDFDAQLHAGKKERGFPDSRIRGDSSVSEAVQNTLAAGIAGRNAPWLLARDIVVFGRGATNPALSPTSGDAEVSEDAAPTAFSMLRDERRVIAAPVTSPGMSVGCASINASPAETLNRGSGILAASVKSLASARGSLKMVLSAMGLQVPRSDEAPTCVETAPCPTDVVLTVT